MDLLVLLSLNKNLLIYFALIIQMFHNTVVAPQEFPIKESQRMSTDVCCTVVSALFALTLFVLACIFFNKAAINDAYFNGFSNTGLNCGNDAVFYSDVNNFAIKSCVSACPTGYYNRNGVCWPNSQALSDKFSANADVSAPIDFDGFKNSLVWTALAAFSIGLLWLIFVQFFPKWAPFIAIALAFITLVTIGVLLLLTHSSFFNNNSTWKIVTAVICFVLAIIIAVMGFFYRNQLRLEATFLEYTRRYLHEVASNYAYILLFLIFTAGLIVLFIFQHCAFSSKAHSDRNFFNFFNPGFLGVLNVIEFIWGLRFLRDAFDYCVSGNAADWYWGPQLFDSQAKVSNIRWSTSFHRLITKNWGSVAGGSFINAFFEIPSLILELLVCHKKTCCSRLGETCDSRCSCFSFISDLVRTDAYAYIHFSGLGFCTAARECAKINRETDTFVGTQNPFKRYRFIVHVFAVALLSFLGYLFANIRVINISFWHIATIITLSYAVVTWFIDIYGAGAEGVSTCFYAEHYTARSYEFMQRAIPSYRKEIEHRSTRSDVLRDGNF